jgi:hypothetical protein
MILFQKRIYREDLKRNPKVMYVFGDNMKRVGMGGQAAEMRGEPNAAGIPTKWAPGMADRDFFCPEDYSQVIHTIGDDFRTLRDHADYGCTIVFPADGLGTGLSELPTRAPNILRYIDAWIEILVARYDK